MGKGRDSNFYLHGFFGGFSEYRYGRKRPRKKTVKRLLNADRQKYVVSRLAETLNDFRLTKFEHEAACRHGLRAAFCLQGHSWSQADHEAALLVNEALKSIGAVRPSFDEGQIYYTVGRDYCARCFAPMEGAIGRFCSPECARAVLLEIGQAHEVQTARIVRGAAHFVYRHSKEKRICEECGRGFYPNGCKPQRFCSRKCGSSVLRKVTEAICEGCGKEFLQPKPGQRCCSQRCAGIVVAKQRAKKVAGSIGVCVECGSEFQARSEKSTAYCSGNCHSRACKRRTRAKKKALANPNIIRLPLPDPRPLTPELVDGLLAA